MLTLEIRLNDPLLVFNEPTGLRENCIGKTPVEVIELTRTGPARCLIRCGTEYWFGSLNAERAPRLGGSMTILTIHRKRVRLGIDAPPHAVFLRQTLYDRIKADLEEKAKEALGASQEAAAVQPEASKAPQSAPETPATSVGGWVAGIFGRRPKRD